MQKMGTKPQKKFRLKSKAMYKPAITEKVIIIDEEHVKTVGKSSIRRKPLPLILRRINSRRVF
jgi:hypothetical protein